MSCKSGKASWAVAGNTFSSLYENVTGDFITIPGRSTIGPLFWYSSLFGNKIISSRVRVVYIIEHEKRYPEMAEFCKRAIYCWLKLKNCVINIENQYHYQTYKVSTYDCICTDCRKVTEIALRHKVEREIYCPECWNCNGGNSRCSSHDQNGSMAPRYHPLWQNGSPWFDPMVFGRSVSKRFFEEI